MTPQFLRQIPHACWRYQIHSMLERYHDKHHSLDELFLNTKLGYMMPYDVVKLMKKLDIPHTLIHVKNIHQELLQSLAKGKKILLLIWKRHWRWTDRWLWQGLKNQHYISIWWQDADDYIVYDSRESNQDNAGFGTTLCSKELLEQQRKLGGFGLQKFYLEIG